jgi:alpha-ribazole phosphatase
MRLWLLRHAAVAWPAGLCYGASDVPADAARTRRAAAYWAGVLPMGVRLRVSALGRAGQLAAALCAWRPDLGPARVDARINEMDFGRWEGMAWDAIPRTAFDAWLADFAHHRVGGGESTQALLDRVAAVLDEELAQARGEDAAWITHAGVIRAVCYLRSGGPMPIPSAAHWPREAPAAGEGLCLDL